MFHKYFMLLLFTAMYSYADAQTIAVTAHDPRIRYEGRIIKQDESAALLWPGSSLKINFNGTGVKAILRDEHGRNYYNVIIDNKIAAVLHPDSTQREYTLASGLADGNHLIELFKRTESSSGKMFFIQFSLDKHSNIMLPSPPKKRKIEFFGNSISCGLAVDDLSGTDNSDNKYADAYNSYTAITARHYDAEMHNTSQSGVGLMVSQAGWTMPDMYNLQDPGDLDNKWDFSGFTPDVVVIELLQNDAALFNQPQSTQFKARFEKGAPNGDQIIKEYRNFLKTIRSTYPKAYIICTLGDMDALKPGSPWLGYVEKAVSSLGDKKTFCHSFAYKNSPGHPNIKEQQTMADELIAFIDQNVKW